MRIGYLALTPKPQDAIMDDHKHGSMNTDVQNKTFAGFIRMVTWGAFIAVGILIFMALANG
jgi:Bacterial aa3 type cytochrome c oxidase subunit IV